ncbi:MAG: M14 family zinc carboxypeptidase [Oceanococcus sp.]
MLNSPAALLGRVTASHLALLLWALLLPGTSWASTAEAAPEQTTEVESIARSSECLRYAKRLGSVYDSDCTDKIYQLTGHHSLNGLPILLREFGADPEHRKPRILVIGGIHGDELSSISIVFAWMRKLAAAQDHSFYWRLTPSANPDGLFRRKAQRTNQRGVDLNRNFPTPNWAEESSKYWIQRTRRNPRRYPGPEPLSEPESRWLHKEIDNFRPDVIVAIHAPYGIVDFDGPSTPPRQLGHLHLNLLGTYPGSLGNYAGVQRGIPVVTVELPSAGSMPSARQQDKIWLDLLEWLNMRILLPAQQASADTPSVN